MQAFISEGAQVHLIGRSSSLLDKIAPTRNGKFDRKVVPSPDQ